MSKRATILTGISAIAAIGFCSTAGHAAALDFGSYADAVQTAQTDQLSKSLLSPASKLAIVDIVAARSINGLHTISIERATSDFMPVLSVGLVGSEETVIRGQKTTFVGYSNYPGIVARSELRLFDSNVPTDGVPHSIQAFEYNGAAHWVPTEYASTDMNYVYRVYDAEGNFDETAPQALKVLAPGAMAIKGNISRADFGKIDTAQIRLIALNSSESLIAHGIVEDADSFLTIEGQIVPVAANGSFSARIIQPAGCKAIDVKLTAPCGKEQSTSVPHEAWTQSAVAQPNATNDQLGKTSATGFDIRSANDGDSPVRDHAIEVRADGNSAEPVMSVGLVGSERTVVANNPAQFQTYTNYPSYVAKSEIRIFNGGQVPDSQPIAVVATDANGFAQWATSSETAHDLFYVYRVYDDKGRFDESAPQELTVLDEPVAIDGAPIPRPNFGLVDEARIRNIAMSRTATVTVSGLADPIKDMVRISGQLVPVNPDGKFITQQLVDRDSKSVKVTIEKDGLATFATSREIDVPRNDWFFVGQGDLTFRSMNGTGPAVEVSGDPLADGNSLTSRAAFYAKGSFGDGWKVTSSLDTGETLLKDIFSNLDRKDPRQLLRRLSSNEYYTTYGDDSTLVQDAPTQGQLYLKVQKADSSLVVGNYIVNLNQAELAPLDRGLFGVALDHKSVATTSFGERKAQFTAFASDPGTLPGRDEFRGTGGSLYFLKRQDLTVGSERVRVEVRDRDTGIILESRDLRPQEDYEIDYFQGRVTLLRPLASTVVTGSTVRETSSAGNVPVLVVRYESTPAIGNLDGYTLGGRSAVWLGDKLRLGASAQRETTETADQTLLGVDAMVRVAAGTYLKGELAQTDGPAFGQANSVDGGLSFTDIATPGIAGRNARAWKLEGAVDLAEIRGLTGDRGKVSAYYENFDAGFAATSQLTLSDTTRWGAALSAPIGQSTNVAAKFEQLTSDAAGSHRVVSVDMTQKLGRSINAKLGVRHDDQVRGLLFNSTEVGARTDAALQIGYGPEKGNWSVYGFGQATLQNEAGRNQNNRVGIGGKAEISDRLSLSAEVSEGDGGLGADVQLSRRYGQGSEAYIGYALLADRTNTGFEPDNLFTRSNSGTLTVGARHRFSSALSIYGENRIGHGGLAPSVMRSVGAKFDPNEKLSFSASFENGQIDDATTGIFKRTAGTFGFGYTTKAVQFGSNVEARFERGVGRDQTVWLLRNTASLQLHPDWRALGRLNIALADNNGANLRAADYVEGVVGFAYRPVLNDRLNVLAKLSYFQDLGPVGQITGGGEINSPKQRSKIGAIDINYDLSKAFTIGAKYGFRQGQVSLDRTSNNFVSSNTHLAILRADWRPVKKWDMVVEGRYLSNDRAGDQRLGGLAAIYRHVGNNAKIGVGYSISDFSDDLTDQSYSSKGVFINLLGKF